MEQNALFRKSALDKLASPERLDVLMQVTSPVGWVALATMALILAAALGWSIFGSYPETVAARGLLLQGTGERPIAAIGSGVLETLTLKSGDVVTRGQLVGRIRIPAGGENATAATAARIASRAELDRRVGQAEELEDTARREIRQLEGERDLDAKSLRDAEAYLGRMKAAPDAYSPNQVLEQDRKVGDLRNRIERHNKGIEDARGRIARASNDRRSADTTYKSQVSQIDATAGGTEAMMEIRSEFDGKVTKVIRSTGEQVQPGGAVAMVMPSSNDGIRAVFFAPIGESPRLRSPMPVRLDFGSVYRREEYGQATAHVTEVGSGAALDAELNNLVQNPTYVAKIKEAGPVTIVRAELIQADTPTGVEWTSGRGPAATLAPNTEITATVEVDRKRPISLVIPFFRKTLGLS